MQKSRPEERRGHCWLQDWYRVRNRWFKQKYLERRVFILLLVNTILKLHILTILYLNFNGALYCEYRRATIDSILTTHYFGSNITLLPSFRYNIIIVCFCLCIVRMDWCLNTSSNNLETLEAIHFIHLSNIDTTVFVTIVISSLLFTSYQYF